MGFKGSFNHMILKAIKYLSLFLGITIFLFGLQLYIHPFSDWAMDQVALSELPCFSLIVLSVSEIITGSTYILAFMLYSQWGIYRWLSISAANIAIIVIMIVVLYARTYSYIPDEIIFFKMNGPQILVIYILLTVINQYMILKILRAKSWT